MGHDARVAVPETERARRIWEKLAPRYDRVIRIPEKLLFSGGREWACSQAKGEVLEIAVGTGRNFEHYPPDVRLTGIDLSPSMLDPVAVRLEGDHLVREPLVHLRAEGFEIEQLERLKWGIVERMVARKPD